MDSVSVACLERLLTIVSAAQASQVVAVKVTTVAES